MYLRYLIADFEPFFCWRLRSFKLVFDQTMTSPSEVAVIASLFPGKKQACKYEDTGCFKSLLFTCYILTNYLERFESSPILPIDKSLQMFYQSSLFLYSLQD
jgi:hypothetical protein